MRYPTKLTFSSPKQVVQVFRWHTIYEKAEYRSPEAVALRKQVWTQPIPSTSGYVHQDRLILPKAITQDMDFARCDLLLLEDGPGSSRSLCLSVSSARRQYDELFRIGTKPGDEPYWLSFYYTHPDLVGHPVRSDFDLSPLRTGHPVRVLVNGRVRRLV